MSNPYLRRIADYIPVPALFHSFLTDKPFDKCLVCQSELLVDGMQYLVERAFVGIEPVYEYAMCVKCCLNLGGDLSEESLMRLKAHFEERVDFEDRRKRLLHKGTKDVDLWIDECLLTKKKRKDCRSYAIYGHCDGPDLFLDDHLHMVSDEGMNQLFQLLSKQTKDRLDDFTDEYLGMPPEFKDQPNTPRFVPL